MSTTITDAIEAVLLSATAAPLAPDTSDPIVNLEHERLAAWERHTLAQEAAEEIEYSLPHHIREPGVLILYATKADEHGTRHIFERDKAEQARAACAEPVYAFSVDELRKFEDWSACGGVFEATPETKAKAARERQEREQWFCRQFEVAWAARDKAMDESGFLAAKAREEELEAAADAIELEMAETVPTTPEGILALARLADERHDSSDGRDSLMLQRIIEALLRLPS